MPRAQPPQTLWPRPWAVGVICTMSHVSHRSCESLTCRSMTHGRGWGESMDKSVRRILVRGSMPPCRLRRIFFENLTTKWCILKYIGINMWSAWRRSPYNPPFRKLLFFACFRFLIFYPFFQGASWPDLPLCSDAHVHGFPPSDTRLC